MYERTHPDHEQDASVTLSYIKRVMEEIARGSHLPPHQYTLHYRTIAEYIAAMPLDCAPLYDIACNEDQHLVRFLRWNFGNLQFTDDEDENDRRVRLLLERDGYLVMIDVCAGIHPVDHLFTGIKVTAFLHDATSTISEYFATVALPYNPSTQSIAPGTDSILASLNLYFSFGDSDHDTYEMRGGKVISGVVDGRYINFYYLCDDTNGMRHFFHRASPDYGQKPGREDNRAPIKLRLNPGVSRI